MRHRGIFKSPEESLTAIYHLSVKIISRGSGRSAIGAAAYRAGEKLRLVEKAAYRAGMELRDEDTEIIYDYSKKGGVVYKEIILPENAPPEYQDRETLWNAVEHREKRCDARLAREIEVALQTEFDLRENIELLREYAKENFVDKGMIVDFAIHNNEGNPHTHMMLTTRHVTPEGFGNKNREWDKEENLLAWRENWARINNRKFEEKGLEERIDHRSYKEQGIDREPTIHMGHEAWALEKKGIQTAKGDYNREIQRRNAEREAQKTAQEQEITAQTYDLNASKNNHGDTERKALMSAKRNMREIEEHLKAEKAEQTAEKMQQQRTVRQETENFAKPMKELQEEYIITDKQLRDFRDIIDDAKYNVPSLVFRAENLDEQTKNFERLQNNKLMWQECRKKALIWEIQKKRDIDDRLAGIECDIRSARIYFKTYFNIEPEQAPEENKRIEEKIKEYTYKQKHAEKMMPELYKKLATIENEYHERKLIAQTRPDSEDIEKLLERWQKPPESVRERQHYERIHRRLNVIAKESVEDIVRKKERQEEQEVRGILARYRYEQEKIRERELERKLNLELNRTIGRSR
jgi:hypothetical protein